MAFEVTPAGITIQTTAEIIAEVNDDFRTKFGENVNVQAEEPFGQVIGIESEREAAVQAQGQSIYQSNDVTTATGASLDVLAAETGTIRQPGLPSVIPSPDALFTGTPGTIILVGSIVRLIQTQTEWQVTAEVTIGGGGTITGTVTALLDGPTSALTAPSTSWEIVTPISGWVSFENTEDANLGRLEESDFDLRLRQQDELERDGNDLEAMRAEITTKTGVTAAQPFENATNAVDSNGIPARAFEFVVDGGADLDIVEAMRITKPPGAQSFGNQGPFPVEVATGTGLFDMFFSRAADIDVWLRITLTTTGAEEPYPASDTANVAAAVLAYAIQTGIHPSGRDVIPARFTPSIQAALTNTASVNIVLVETSDDGVIFANAVLPMGPKEKADFDSARIEVVIV